MRKLVCVVAAVVIAACTPSERSTGEARNVGEAVALAAFHDDAGDSVGTATLQQGPAGVVIRLELDGLAAGWKAIHIHQSGTCEDHHDGFQASGGHFDPEDRMHGLLNGDGPELGDLPNIWVTAEGVVNAEIYAPGVGLDPAGALPSLLAGNGTALVIHENPDDHRSQPIGGAGSRIACGVVERSER